VLVDAPGCAASPVEDVAGDSDVDVVDELVEVVDVVVDVSGITSGGAVVVVVDVDVVVWDSL
jgi:hypothetical protein